MTILQDILRQLPTEAIAPWLATVNPTEYTYGEILLCASQYGFTELVKVLLTTYDIDSNVVEDAFKLARDRGQIETMALLIAPEHGVSLFDLFVTDNMTSLNWLIEQGYHDPDSFISLVRIGNVKAVDRLIATDDYGYIYPTGLQVAIENNQLKLVERFLALGVEVNFDMLYTATVNNDLDIVRLIATDKDVISQVITKIEHDQDYHDEPVNEAFNESYWYLVNLS